MTRARSRSPIDGGRWVGMAGGYWFEREPGIAQLWGLWVEPAARGTRIGAALVGAVADWAVRGGATYVRLGIIEPADELRRFYAGLGFVALDDPAPMRTDPTRCCGVHGPTDGLTRGETHRHAGQRRPISHNDPRIPVANNSVTSSARTSSQLTPW